MLFKRLFFLGVFCLNVPSILLGTNANQQQDIGKTFQIKAGEFAELNLVMEKNSTVTVEFNADQKVAWNIHTHKNKETIIQREGSALGEKVEFKAENQGVFSYLWKNQEKKESNIVIKVTLGDGVKIHSWHGEKT